MIHGGKKGKTGQNGHKDTNTRLNGLKQEGNGQIKGQLCCGIYRGKEA